MESWEKCSSWPALLQAIAVLRNLPRQYEGGFCSSGLVNVEAADDQIHHRGTYVNAIS